MIWKGCLAEAVKDGRISQSTADKYEQFYEDAAKEAEQMGKGGVDAYTFAVSKGAERMMAAVGQKKSALAKEVIRMDYNIADVQRGTKGLFEAMRAKLGELVRGGGVERSLVSEQRAAYATMQSRLTDFIEQLRSKNLGLTRDVAPARDAVTELYGRDSGKPSAKTNAEGWKQVIDWAADRLEEEGVHISKRDDWFLPQKWNSLKVRAAGQDGFTAWMLDAWKRDALRLRDFKTTSEAFLQPGKDDARVLEILQGDGKRKPGAYQNITTHGDASIEPGISNRESMADRYNRRRVFEWTTPDSYFAFQDRFGNGADNLGEQFISQLHSMAHDIGTARTLGGDPDQSAKTLIQWAKKEAIEAGKPLSKGEANTLEATYFHASGQANAAVNVALANLGKTVRQWMASTQLHSAVLGSAPDFAFLHSTAAFNGLDMVKLMPHYLNEMKGDKRQAMQLGLIIEDGIRGIRDISDEIFSESGGKIEKGSLSLSDRMEAASSGAARVAGRASDFVMRGTGLSHHSTSGRNALGKTMLAGLADDAGKTFDKLDPGRRSFLERYGIDSDGWNILREHAMPEEGDKLFMDPAYLAFRGTAAGRDVALRLLGGLDAEMKRAIPEGGVASRALMLGQTLPGTWSGEARRAIQYKGFTLGVTQMHGWRAWDQFWDKNGAMPKGQYISVLAIEATVLGALSLQLKNIANGKNLEDMTTVSYWGKAAVMGGAGGILGDQVKTALQTRSMDDAARLVSPTAGLVVGLTAMTMGNIGQASEGKPANFGREGTTFLRKNLLPRLWYTNLAADRLGWDTLQRMADPDAAGAFYRTEQRTKKDTGQGFWWRPGSTSPDRAPQMSEAPR